MGSSSQIDQVLSNACKAGHIPGVVAMATCSGDIRYEGAFGHRELCKVQPMTADSVFWIASMTKAITAAAAMQLVEQGKLSLDEPIGKVLPEFAKLEVLEGFAADGTPHLRPAKTPVTLRQLLTHTAGYCYDMWNSNMRSYVERIGLPRVTSGRIEALRAPLVNDPGTRWEYGINIDVVGQAIEAASGQRLDAYLRDNLFVPLGMTDTGFGISRAMRDRLVGMHSRAPDGSLQSIAFEIEQNPEFHAGGGGLYSTARDYTTFMRMILNKGRGPQSQLLKPETVALMSRNHIGNLTVGRMTSAVASVSNDVDFYPDMPKTWGLSFMINTAQTPEGRSPGSLAWAGLANTYYWIDPTRDVSGVILMQVLPFVDPGCFEIFRTFEREVYTMLHGDRPAA